MEGSSGSFIGDYADYNSDEGNTWQGSLVARAGFSGVPQALQYDISTFNQLTSVVDARNGRGQMLQPFLTPSPSPYYQGLIVTSCEATSSLGGISPLDGRFRAFTGLGPQQGYGGSLNPSISYQGNQPEDHTAVVGSFGTPQPAFHRPYDAFIPQRIHQASEENESPPSRASLHGQARNDTPRPSRQDAVGRGRKDGKKASSAKRHRRIATATSTTLESCPAFAQEGSYAGTYGAHNQFSKDGSHTHWIAPYDAACRVSREPLDQRALNTGSLQGVIWTQGHDKRRSHSGLSGDSLAAVGRQKPPHVNRPTMATMSQRQRSTYYAYLDLLSESTASVKAFLRKKPRKPPKYPPQQKWIDTGKTEFEHDLRLYDSSKATNVSEGLDHRVRQQMQRDKNVRCALYRLHSGYYSQTKRHSDSTPHLDVFKSAAEEFAGDRSATGLRTLSKMIKADEAFGNKIRGLLLDAAYERDQTSGAIGGATLGGSYMSEDESLQ